jgi:chemotaxis protein CheX
VVQEQIVDAFFDAVRQVFEETGIGIEAIGTQEPAAEEHQVVTSVGLVGDLKGIFMLLTDTPSATSIVRSMTGGMGIALRDDMIDQIQMAALGELSNQISGRAITLLSDHGLHCDITPPAVLAARQLKSLVPDLAQSSRRVITGPFGRITLFIGFTTTEPADRREKTS